MSLKEAREKIVHLRNEMRNESVRTEWINGYIDGLDEALYAIDDSSIDKVPGQLTLTELARELRKTLRFRWLTLDRSGYITLWNRKPYWDEYRCWSIGLDVTHISYAIIPPRMLCENLDLSGYKAWNGRVEYSSCIVEVE